MLTGTYISDENGEPRVFYVKGGDPAQPEKAIPTYLEVRPGGMTVARALPAGMGRITVAPDPTPPPPLAEVEEARRRRIIEQLDRDRAANAAERGETVPPNASAGTDADLLDRAAAEQPADVEPPEPAATADNGDDDQDREEADARERAARTARSGARTRSRTRA